MSKLVKIMAGLALLAACQLPPPSLRGNLTVFHQLEDYRGKSIFIEAPSKEKQDSLEFANYAKIIADKLVPKGFVIANEKNKADLVAKLDYSIDNGTTFVSTYPVPRMGYYGGFNNSPYPYWMQKNYAESYYNYPPYAPNGYTTETVVSREYSRNLSLDIADAKGKKLYEAKLKSSGACGSLSGIFEGLAEIMLQEFPGSNGQTRSISLPWEIRC